MIAWLRNLIVL